jgi:hypothetical protein
MGFDLNITCTLNVCKETGKPFFLDRNGARRFDLSQIGTVPFEYRRFLALRGSVFQEYVQSFGDTLSVNAAEFLERFPTWDELEIAHDSEWTSLDHNK